MPRNIDALKQFAWWLKASKNEKLWNVLRRGAGVEQREDAIRRACKAFGLDAENSADRNLLLGILADAHFPNTLPGMNALAYRQLPEKRGRPVKWNKAAADLLVKHIIEVWPVEPPYPGPTELAETLKNRFSDEYRDIQAETLARYLNIGPPSWK
jgi:hypothetical protein